MRFILFSISMSLSIMLVSHSVFARDAQALMDWHREIPTSVEKVLERIDIQASYFSVDNDEGSCGGEVSNPELQKYITFRTDGGRQIHEVQIGFKVSVSDDNCQSIKQVYCQATLDIVSKDGIDAKPLECDAI